MGCVVVICVYFFFFFKQKTAYEMRISDWSSDVCSSDLSIPLVVLTSNGTRELSDALRRRCLYHFVDYPTEDKEARILTTRLPQVDATQIGRASCRERVCQYV